MKKMKKTLAMLLCIIMCLSLFPVQALAEETVTAGTETAETAAVETPVEESTENAVSAEESPAEVPVEGQEPAGEPVEGNPTEEPAEGLEPTEEADPNAGSDPSEDHDSTDGENNTTDVTSDQEEGTGAETDPGTEPVTGDDQGNTGEEASDATEPVVPDETGTDADAENETELPAEEESVAEESELKEISLQTLILEITGNGNDPEAAENTEGTEKTEIQIDEDCILRETVTIPENVSVIFRGRVVIGMEANILNLGQMECREDLEVQGSLVNEGVITLYKELYVAEGASLESAEENLIYIDEEEEILLQTVHPQSTEEGVPYVAPAPGTVMGYFVEQDDVFLGILPVDPAESAEELTEEETTENAAPEIIEGPVSEETTENAAPEISGTPASEETTENAAPEISGTLVSEETTENAALEISEMPVSVEDVQPESIAAEEGTALQEEQEVSIALQETGTETNTASDSSNEEEESVSVMAASPTAPKNADWGEYFGVVEFDYAGDADKVFFEYVIKKDSVEWDRGSWTLRNNSTKHYRIDLRNADTYRGEYTDGFYDVTVYAVSRSNRSSVSAGTTTVTRGYYKPDGKLPQPEGVTVIGTEVSWLPVEGANGYQVIYYSKALQQLGFQWRYDDNTVVNYTSWEHGIPAYVCVRALSEDLETIYSSEITERVSVTDKSKEEISFMFSFSPGFTDKKDYQKSATFNPKFFSEDADVYNHSLAQLSIRMAMSAYNSNTASGGKYSNGPINIKKFLNSIGCNNIKINSDYTSQPTSHSIGLAAGSKRIKVNNQWYTLVVLAVRGGNYETEWGGNFVIGEDTLHSGFSTAANKAYSFLNDYITKQNITGNVKLWISGYSRAAATSNLLGGMLDNGKNTFSNGTTVPTKNIYVYTFETPAGVTKSANPRAAKYGNIFNIVNPNDFVTKVAMSAWNFQRYGVDCLLPYWVNDNVRDYYSKIQKLTDIWKFREPYLRLYSSDVPIGMFLDGFFDRFAKFVGGRSNYCSRYQTTIRQDAEFEGGIPYLGIAHVIVTGTPKNASNIGELITDAGYMTANGDLILSQHFAELCLSWMDTIGSLGSYWNGEYRLFSVHCPVDVKVLLNGQVVAEVRNEEVVSWTDGLVYVMADENGHKEFLLMSDDHFDIEISAYDEGEMDIAITDYSEIDGKTKRTNFFDVELDGGQVFETGVSGGSVSDSGYTLETEGQTVTADVVLYEGDFDNTSVTATARGNGVTDGSGIYSLGDYAVLRAEPGEGAAFAGWYDESGTLLSRDEVYGFTVKENLSLTAVFGDANAELTVDKDYVILETTKTASSPIASVTDSVWNEFITCEVRSDGEEPVIALEDGEITGLRAGTAWIDYTVEIGDRTLMAQSRIDVTDGGNPPEEEIEDVTLRQDQVTVELYSEKNASVQIFPALQQNIQSDELSAPEVQNNGVAVRRAEFVEQSARELFNLQVCGDGRVELVPTTEALNGTIAVPDQTVSAIRVWVGITEKEFTTPEQLTVKIGTELPKLQAEALTVESFPDVINGVFKFTGAKAAEITEDPDHAGSLPSWIELGEGAAFTINEDHPENWKDTLYLSVRPEGYRKGVPVQVKMTLKMTAPQLKLSAASVTMTDDYENSRGVELVLSAKTKDTRLEDLGVTGLMAGDGYRIENFDPESGRFTLLANRTPVNNEKVAVIIRFDGCTRAVQMLVSVKVKPTVKLKASVTAVKLNPMIPVDQAVITLTADPADYSLSEESFYDGLKLLNGKTEEAYDSYFDITYSDGTITVRPLSSWYQKDLTLSLQFKGGHDKDPYTSVKLTLLGYQKAASVKFKISGSVDANNYGGGAVFTPSFTNYNGTGALEEEYIITAMDPKTKRSLGKVTDWFNVERDGTGAYTVSVADDYRDTIDPALSYSFKVFYSLMSDYNQTDGNEEENETPQLITTFESPNTAFKVKRTKLSFKLSPSGAVLNSTVHNGEIYDGVTVSLTPNMQNYPMDRLEMIVTDAKGSVLDPVPLDLKLFGYDLLISANSDSAPGSKYLVKLMDGSTEAAKINVTTLAAGKDDISVTAAVKGSLELTKQSSQITVTPTVKNVSNPELYTLSVTVSAMNGEDQTANFRVERSDDSFVLTPAEGIHLDPTLKYSVTVRASVGETGSEFSSAPKSIQVKQSKAAVTADPQSVTLYSRDKNSTALIQIVPKTADLSPVERVELPEGSPYALKDLGNGWCELGFLDGSIPSKGQKLTLKVYLDGCSVTKETATASITVVIR